LFAHSATKAPKTPNIERNGSLAGTLLVRPRCAHRGARLAIAARNLGEVAMVHGVCARVQRPSDGSWRDAAFIRNQVCIQIAAITRTGENQIRSLTYPGVSLPGAFGRCSR
jgi:hypothetical protein